MTRLALFAAALGFAACSSGDAPLGPDPRPVYASPSIPTVLPVPSPQQLAYQRMETNAFVHFGPNTFTGEQWGTGDAAPDVFAPTAFDPSQWMALFREVGLQGVVLTAKHHDGFLLWPSSSSDYSVASSAWRDGQGDVVKDVAEAARAAGLAFGVYLSPWDRNAPMYGTPAYNNYFVSTIWELMAPGGYGPMFEVWLDGAYGPEVTREQLDTYDLSRWDREIRTNQPGAIIALSRDVFWPGNEYGTGPVTNWSVRADLARWAPYECDTTVRTEIKWFWNADDEPRTLDDLVNMYFESVGRACTLLLNVPPDQRGLIAEEDAARLREWKAARDAIFADDLARHAEAEASATRPGAFGWAPGAALDGEPDSFWAAPEGTDGEVWLEVDLGASRFVNVAELMEPIRFGQRIAAFRLEAFVNGAWAEVVRGTTVNYKRLLRFEPVTAQRWRVVIEDARAAPALSTVGLYSVPGWASRWAEAGQLD